MHITLIVAMSTNQVIGQGRELPWTLRDDLRRFRRLTMGHTIIMGRKTFESVGWGLDGRETIVLTRDPLWTHFKATVARSMEEALAIATPIETSNRRADPEIFIVGGAQVYASALPHATRMYVTVVHAEVKGNIKFPKIHWNNWSLLREESFPASPPQNQYASCFRVYERAKPF